MSVIEHGVVTSTNSPSGNRGVHSVEGFNAVADEAARAAIVQVASDRGRIVYQTGGTSPGWYLADGAGAWTGPLGAGEANTGANVGTGDGIFRDKTGVTLNFKTLTEGAGIELTSSADEVEIAAAPEAFVLVYRPGEPDPFGLVFADFNALFSTFQTIQGKVEIWFDDSITSPCPIPELTGSGTYDFENRTTFVGPSRDPRVEAVCQNACLITGLLGVRSIELNTVSTSPVITLTGGAIFHMDLDARLAAGAAAPLISVPAGQSAVIFITRAGEIDSPNPVVNLVGDAVSGGDLTIRAADSRALVTSEQVTGGANTFLGLIASPMADLSTTQTTVATINRSFSGDAGRVAYTPADPAEWVDPDPTIVSEGLDDLAGRLSTAVSPANVTKAAAAVGVSFDAARADHKHDVSTAAPGATGVGTTSGEGVATSLARSDHSHQSNTAPANVTKSAAAIGTSGQPARADHKHDIATAAPSQGIGGSNAEGSSTSLARADHDHTIRETGGPTNLTVGAIPAGLTVKRSGTALVGQEAIASITEVEVTDGDKTTTSTTYVDVAGASITFTPRAGERVMFIAHLVLTNTVSTSPAQENSIDVQQNNSGSFVGFFNRTPGYYGAEDAATFNDHQVAIVAPFLMSAAVSTTIKLVFRVALGTARIQASAASAIKLQLVRF